MKKNPKRHHGIGLFLALHFIPAVLQHEVLVPLDTQASYRLLGKPAQ